MHQLVKINIENEQSMVKLGHNLARCINKRAILYLEGELGAGKTTLCRGIIQNFADIRVVKSPTYTLVETYDLKNQKIYHFDLYRMEDPEEFEYIGGYDYFSETAIFLVEWPSKGEGIIPVSDINIVIKYNYFKRIVTLEAKTKEGLEILQNLKKTIY